MNKGRNQQRAAVLALLLSSVSAETNSLQTLTNNAIAQSQAINLNSNQEAALESFIDGTESVIDQNDSQADSQMKDAIKQEKKAEIQALKAEQIMQDASDNQQRKLAKRKLNKAQKRLELAQFRLQEVQKSFAGVSQNEGASDSDSSDNEQSGLAQQTSQVDIAQELQERANMKEFFKQSTVYKNFKAEESKELTDKQECKATKTQIDDVKQDYGNLKNKFDSLSQILSQNGKNTEPTASEKAKEILKTSHVKEPLMHLEPAPLDQQYDVPAQMKKPLIPENRTDKNDLGNIYNPNKYQNDLGNYQKNTKSKNDLKQIDQTKNASISSNSTKKQLAQISPMAPTGLEPPPPDYQYDVPHQMKHPLNRENQVDDNDILHHYNANKYLNHIGNYAQKNQTLSQINPSAPTGLEPPPPDYQYDVPHQMKHPLNRENQVDENDILHHYNPNKNLNHIGNYAQSDESLTQINPYSPTGLEPPPKDYQYDVPHQMLKPLIDENKNDFNDLGNVYNANKYAHTLGEYVQLSNQAMAQSNNTIQVMAQINPYSPTGLEPPPKDQQYDVPHQMLKPLIDENKNDFNDLGNVYNANKYAHTLGEYAQVGNQTKQAMAQINPYSPTGLEPPPKDKQYDVPHQMLKPLIDENKNDFNDLGNVYNANKYAHTLGEYAQVGNQTKQAMAQINPYSPTGLEPPPKDQQYEVPHQMLKPLIDENKNDFNDLGNVYNPNKYSHTLGEYAQKDKSLAQINPYSPTGLEPPPKDQQYEVPHQMLKPLIDENKNDFNDLGNVYNPNKYSHTLGEYAQVGKQTKQSIAQISPMAPTGLEPPPPDYQYDVPHQMKHPLNRENQVDDNDILHHYNANKYLNHIGNYAQMGKSLVQINPYSPTGLEPPPKDYQYDVPHQMLKPLIDENKNDFNDLGNVYNANKYAHTLGEYIQIEGTEAAKKRSHEVSDSDESESSDDNDSGSDDESDGDQESTKMSRSQIKSNEDKTQTIEIKIVTANSPNEAPKVNVVHPVYQDVAGASLTAKIASGVSDKQTEKATNQTKVALKQSVIAKQNQVEQQIKQQIKQTSVFDKFAAKTANLTATKKIEANPKEVIANESKQANTNQSGQSGIKGKLKAQVPLIVNSSNNSVSTLSSIKASKAVATNQTQKTNQTAKTAVNQSQKANLTVASNKTSSVTANKTSLASAKQAVKVVTIEKSEAKYSTPSAKNTSLPVIQDSKLAKEIKSSLKFLEDDE